MKKIKGRPVLPGDNDDRDYLRDKLAEIRRSCEWPVSLGAATVLTYVLRNVQASDWLHRATLFCVLAQVALAIAGAVSWDWGDQDRNAEVRILQKVLRRRLHLRRSSLLFLALAAMGIVWAVSRS